MKNNKKHLTIYIVIMCLFFAVTLCAYLLLPDTIPAHYGYNGEVDRWGSKIEIFILPATALVFAVIMLCTAKFTSFDENKARNNEKIVLVVGECSLILFFIMQCCFLYFDFKNVTDINSASIDINRIISGCLAVFLIVVGNIMPKAKLNSFVGFRIPWSMKNDDVWKQCQRFAGIVSIITGIVILISLFFVKNTASILVLLCAIAVMCIVDTVYAYRASHK